MDLTFIAAQCLCCAHTPRISAGCPRLLRRIAVLSYRFNALLYGRTEVSLSLLPVIAFDSLSPNRLSCHPHVARPCQKQQKECRRYAVYIFFNVRSVSESTKTDEENFALHIYRQRKRSF